MSGEITEKLRPRAGLMRRIKFINSPAKHELPRERKVVKGGKKLRCSLAFARSRLASLNWFCACAAHLSAAAAARAEKRSLNMHNVFLSLAREREEAKWNKSVRERAKIKQEDATGLQIECIGCHYRFLRAHRERATERSGWSFSPRGSWCRLLNCSFCNELRIFSCVNEKSGQMWPVCAAAMDGHAHLSSRLCVSPCERACAAHLESHQSVWVVSVLARHAPFLAAPRLIRQQILIKVSLWLNKRASAPCNW